MTIRARFAASCNRCKGQITVGQDIEWTRGTAPVHTHAADCVVAAPVVAVSLDVTPLASFLQAAKDRGLKFPKARFLGPDGVCEIRLSLAGPDSSRPGSVVVKLDGRYQGSITTTGEIVGGLRHDARLILTLTSIGQNPAKAAKAYGALMCRCSFCHLALTDAGSVEAGYGPVCAEKFDLPHVAKGTPALRVVPVARQLVSA